MPQARDPPLLQLQHPPGAEAAAAAGRGVGVGGCAASCQLAARAAQRDRRWRSRPRVLLCLWGGTFMWSTAWLGSYVVWLADGCLVFLPCVPPGVARATARPARFPRRV